MYSRAIILGLLMLLSACQSAYYSAMETVGQHKRDILVSRVESANDAQEDAQEEFISALDGLTALINFDGGELAEHYQQTNEQYQASKNAADDVSAKIIAIEDVAEALFDEWQEEIAQFSNKKLQLQSKDKLRQTKNKYQKVIKSMHQAEQSMQPVLAALKDNSLYLKHNLNAQAVGALEGEYRAIKSDINVLISEMKASIATSKQFIANLQN